MSKKVVIIGAGIAGLCAGCYARMNGYETTIYEMHDLPGGLCTSWNRKGYIFDGCLHWLTGTRPGTPFYQYWHEVGALEGMDFIRHPIQIQMENTTGEKLTLFGDIDQLEKQLLELAPEDQPAIAELTSAVRKLQKMKIPMDKPQDMIGFWDMVKILPQAAPYLKEMERLNGMSLEQFSDKLKNPFLREALHGLIPKEYSLLIFVMVLVTHANNDAGWPMGGSLAFAGAIERSYLKMGGKIQYRSRVDKILVKEDRAMGVLLGDGTRVLADDVISAADGHTTIFQMLDGRYLDEKIRKQYDNTPLAPTSVQVSLGVDCDLSNEPIVVGIKPNQTFLVGGVHNDYCILRHYCYDASMAPKGKSVVTALLYSNYAYWEKLYKEDRAGYTAQKKQVADEVIRVFEQRFPYAKGKVEVVDVATPYTYTRYTGTWKGAYMGWLTTPENHRTQVSGRLPNLKNLYLAGQWANLSGGVPVGVLTGRWSVMRLCKDDGKKFVVAKHI